MELLISCLTIPILENKKAKWFIWDHTRSLWWSQGKKQISQFCGLMTNPGFLLAISLSKPTIVESSALSLQEFSPFSIGFPYVFPMSYKLEQSKISSDTVLGFQPCRTSSSPILSIEYHQLIHPKELKWALNSGLDGFCQQVRHNLKYLYILESAPAKNNYKSKASIEGFHSGTKKEHGQKMPNK